MSKTSHSTALDSLIPEPRLLELDHADVAVPADEAWSVVRHADLARSPIVHALFALRTLPARFTGHAVESARMTIDDIGSGEGPGFRILDESEREVVVGAIGKVWKLDIPFVEVETAEAFVGFATPGYIRVAWALRAVPLGASDARLEVELRVDATDEDAWQHFRRYFRIIGPGSLFIRRHLLAAFARELGAPETEEDERPLPGDELLPDAGGQTTDGITIAASPEAIWPWLVQMGCRRAGWYSYDRLDNAGVASAREIRPELQNIAVGDVLPATPEGEDGFEVLRIEPPHALVLGGLFDPESKGQLSFSSERPERYWHVTWSFTLEPRGDAETRLLVRARASFPPSGRLHLAWIWPVHHFMQRKQLKNLKARAESMGSS